MQAFLMGKGKLRILQVSAPFMVEHDAPCEECAWIEERNREVVKAHRKSNASVLEHPPVERYAHNHYWGASGWFVELAGSPDASIKYKGAVLSEKELQRLCRSGVRAAEFAAMMAGQTLPPPEQELELMGTEIARIPMAELKAALIVTAPCRLKSETRKHLTGVAVRTDENGRISFIATDGHKAAWYDLAGERTTADRDGILSAAFVDYVLKIKKPAGEAILMDQVTAPKKKGGDDVHDLYVQLPDGVCSAVSEGRFPHIHSVIPELERCEWSIVVSLDQLLANLRMVSKQTSEHTKPCMLAMNGTRVRLVSRETIDQGESRAEVAAYDVRGTSEGIAIGLNAANMLPLLKNFQSDVVRISGNGSLNAFRCDIPGLPQLGMVVMPLRLEDYKVA
jgi:DNA polymerase III sliding clamp (beta) subunit (PCNA family)